MTFRPSMKSIKAFAVAAFASAAMFGGAAEAQQINWNYLNDAPVRLEAGGVSGNSPGVQDGYYRAGGFLSIIDDQNSILFLDGHGNVNYDSGNFSGDVGVGYRQNVDGTVIGGNAYYNYREYSNGFSEHNFSTIGFGTEVLMSDWAIRSNAAFALNGRKSNGRTAFAIPGGPDYVPQMGGSAGVSNIRLATQTENWDEALDTYDLNISRKIPSVRTEVGAGVYYLSADDGPNAWGVNGTAEMWATSNIAGNVTVSHDDLFDTTVYGGVSVYFGGPAIDATSRSQSVASRLWSRVQRRNVVPVLNYTADAPDLLATDPGTGDLITVAQIGMGGDLLGAPDLLEDDGEFIDIILVDPGAAFTPMDTIALNDGQRLLSAHIFHDVDTTEVGLIQLPETDLGGPAAMISGSAGFPAITLANDNEVSGFLVVAGTGSDAIFGTDVTGFNINRNVLNGNMFAGQDGIDIESAGIDVSGVIADNMIYGFDDMGVELNADNVDVDFLFNDISDNFDDNVDIDATGNVAGLFLGNMFNRSVSDNGLDIQSATISAAIIDNQANENGTNGADVSGIFIEVDNVLAGSVLEITDNTTNLNGFDGIGIFFNGDLDSEVFIDDNTADLNDNDGIAVESFGMGDILGTISNNTTNGNDPGIRIVSNDAASDILVDIIGNLASNNDEEGILIDSAGDFIGLIAGNVANENGDNGLFLNAGNNIDFDLVGNMFNDNAGDGDGAQIEAGGNIIGEVSGNTANDNQEAGLYFFADGDIDLQVLNNTTNRNSNNDSVEDAGISLLAEGSVSGLVDNNTATGNDESGIYISADNDGNNVGDVNAVVSNNTTSNNGRDGIYIEGENFFGDVLGNTANSNDRDGVRIEVASDIGTALDAALVDGNMIGTGGGNGNRGLRIIGDDIFLILNNNVVSNNDRNNIDIDAETLTGSSFSNVANDSVNGDGLMIRTQGVMDFDITALTVDGNDNHGAQLLTQGGDINGDITASFFGLATGTGNGQHGLRLRAGVMDGTGSFNGDISFSLANNNGDDGFNIRVRDDMTGSIIGDGAGVLSGNGRDGFHIRIFDTFSGTIIGNTASFNGDDGFDATAGTDASGGTFLNFAFGNGGADFTGNLVP